MNLTNIIDTRRIKPDASGWTVAAGTSDVNSDVVDLQGYEGVRFIAGFGALTSGAVTSLKVQQGAASDLSDAADLENSKITVADTDDNKVAITDIYRPRERYVRVAFDRGTQNAVIDFLLVELYGPKKLPPAAHSTVIAAEKHVSPAEGTA
jgi:hypothetical protein